MDVTENEERIATKGTMDDIRMLNHRYELVAWGTLFIFLGAVNLIPGMPAGTGWLGIAIILLGLNLVRYLGKIPTSIVSITIGIISLVLGVSRLLHLRGPLPFFETALIVIGVVLLVSGVSKRHSLGCCF
ncbi:MAG TPA: hypothetical protein VN368_01430 [Candidatus Methylomirabilis sp.]|nr:hypothetical protein [Candidatus Methylomirabilis sp.]